MAEPTAKQTAGLGLLSSLILPATDCESCLTGPVVCPEDYCLLDYMGNLTDSVTVTQSGTVKIVTSTVPEDCLLTILAVCGGGSGGVKEYLGFGGGGGLCPRGNAKALALTRSPSPSP